MALLQYFRFAAQITLDAINTQRLQGLSFRARLDSLGIYLDIYAVHGICQGLYEKLVVTVSVDIADMAAVNFKVAELQAAQVTER